MLQLPKFWPRVDPNGVQSAVEVMPFSVYSSRSARGDFAVGLRGWNSPTAEAGNALFVLLGTYDASSGRGAQNWARYANPALDNLTDEALATLDTQFGRR